MAQVPNKNIDNAAGQVVRLDIQNTTKAVATHNFGARNDAGTILPCEFLADDTTNKLLIRGSSGGDQANPNPTSGTAATFFEVGNLDEANLGLLPKAGGTMTGQLLADDGSGAGAPAISFDGDTDTGMYRSSANKIGFATAGSERAIFDNFGLSIENQGHIAFRESSSNGASGVTLKAPASLSGDVNFTLPGADGTNGQMIQTNGSGALSFTTVAGVPIGSVFCIAHTSIPSGYVECNGASIPNGTGTVNGVTANFAPLRALIGSNLPDLRGEFIRGFDNGRGVDSGRSMLETQSSQFGQHNHSFSGSSNSAGSHNHWTLYAGGANQGKLSEHAGDNYAAVTSSYVGNDSRQDAEIGARSGSTANAGKTSSAGSHSHSISGSIGNQGGTDNSSETRPRNIAMMYIIKF